MKPIQQIGFFRTPLNRGIFCILFSAFCFAFMNLNVRLAGDIPFVQKSFFRNSIALLFSVAVIVRKKIPLRLPVSSLPFIAGRCVCGTIGVLCNFYAVDHLALSDASMLNKMSPFFAIIFSLLLLGEKLTAVQTAGIVAAFAGSILVIKPDFHSLASIPALIGLCGGLGAGIAYTCVRKVSSMQVRGPVIVFYFCCFSSLVTLPYTVFKYTPMTMQQLMYLLFAGVAAAGGQFGITSAYMYAPAREVSVYDYFQVPFSALLGFIVFAQLPDMLSWCGYTLIIGSAVALYFYNARTHQHVRA